MGTDQLQNKVSWLDEQRRKDLEALLSLDDRITELEKTLKGQSKKVDSVAADTARVAAQAARVNTFEDAVAKHRQEVARHVEESEVRREERAKNSEAVRKSDYDGLSARLAELSERVTDLGSLDNVLKDRQAETVRLTRKLDELEKRSADLQSKLEDAMRTMASAESGRGAELKRAAEFHLEFSNQRTRLEAGLGTIETLEDRTRKAETRITELEAGERERRAGLDAWMETQSRHQVDFERQWAAWGERFTAFERQADTLDERMIQYEETFRSTRQLQAELEKVLDRLERRIHEVSEIQRLAEDRFKQEWNAFQADDQKRWNTHKLTNDEQWREHDRRHEKMGKELEALRQASDEAAAKIKQISDGIDQRVRGLLTAVRGWTEDLES